MNSKHTPGPWEVAIKNPHCVLAPSPAGLCIVATLPKEGTQLPRTETNARLIAAAPELLAALKLSLTLHESAAMLHRECFESCAWETLRDAASLRADSARAAIAKAGGEAVKTYDAHPAAQPSTRERMKPKPMTPNIELGLMHDSGPDGCPDDCEACAREDRFAVASKRALSLLGAGNTLEVLSLLWQAHNNAPTTDVRARVVGVLREMRKGRLDDAETRLAQLIEIACFD